MKTTGVQNNIYIMVGLPGAGKSYWLEQNVLPYQVVSRDKIRFEMLKPGDRYFDHEKEVFKKFVADIVERCNTCTNVYCDATHVNAKSRYKLINSIMYAWDKEEDPVFHIIYIATGIDNCLKNNDLREGLQRVKEDVIIEANKRRTTPHFGEYDYGSITSVIYKYNSNDKR